MAPPGIDYGTAIVGIGCVNPKTKLYTVKIEHLNKLYQGTAARFANLSRVMADNFQLFAVELDSLVESFYNNKQL